MKEKLGILATKKEEGRIIIWTMLLSLKMNLAEIRASVYSY